MSWKLRWAGWNKGLRRVRLASGYRFVSAVQDAIGNRGSVAESAKLSAALNKAAAKGDREEVNRLQALIQEQADKRLRRGIGQ